MNFSSFTYILIFLPAVALLCAMAKRLPLTKAPQSVVLLASVIFYGWAKISFLPYLCGSILVNWYLAKQLAARSYEKRKPTLFLGLFFESTFFR